MFIVHFLVDGSSPHSSTLSDEHSMLLDISECILIDGSPVGYSALPTGPTPYPVVRDRSAGESRCRRRRGRESREGPSANRGFCVPCVHLIAARRRQDRRRTATIQRHPALGLGRPVGSRASARIALAYR